jgi:hypothetical protein
LYEQAEQRATLSFMVENHSPEVTVLAFGPRCSARQNDVPNRAHPDQEHALRPIYHRDGSDVIAHQLGGAESARLQGSERAWHHQLSGISSFTSGDSVRRGRMRPARAAHRYAQSCACTR